MAIDDEVAETINGLWVFVAALLIFLLQAGFGLLEVGSVRAKNAKNIMMKNLLDVAVAAVLSYWAVGFAFGFGDGGNSFIGKSFFFLKGTEDYIFWFFQYVFASTASTIVSGAVAERCRFTAYLTYSCALTAFIYPVVTHWVWHEDGWLEGKVHDYAGGGVVHGVGGAAAMSAAWILGPQIGRFVKNDDTGKVQVMDIPGHNLVFAALGAFILWFGFIPFNSASGLNIVGKEGLATTCRVALITILSGATGAFTMLLFGRWKLGVWGIVYALNGMLAGLIATCSRVDTYQPAIALVVGFTGAFVYWGQNWLFENVLRIDDPLAASPIHMGAGFWGLILVGFLASPDYVGDDRDLKGVFYGGNGKQLGYNLLGTVVFFAWAFGTCTMLFWTLNKFGRFRVSEEVEKAGLDQLDHGGSAYRVGSVVISQLQAIQHKEHMEPESALAHDLQNALEEMQEEDEEVGMAGKEAPSGSKREDEATGGEEATPVDTGGLRQRMRRGSSIPGGAA